MRTIKQIETFQRPLETMLIALCDDGTVWMRDVYRDREWKSLAKSPRERTP